MFRYLAGRRGTSGKEGGVREKGDDISVLVPEKTNPRKRAEP